MGGPTPKSGGAAGSQTGGRPTRCRISEPPYGPPGWFQWLHPIPGLSEAAITQALHLPSRPRNAQIPLASPVTLDLSQWRPRLDMSNRERWGRPGRHRVPGATDPVLQSNPRPCQVGGEEGQQVRPLAGPGRHVERARGPTTGVKRRTGGRRQGGSPPHAPLAAHRRRASRRPSRRPRGRRGRPARAPVRRVQGQRGPRDQRAGRPVPRRGRPVRLERPAQALGRARGRGARAAREGADPLRPRPRHPRRLRPLVGLPRVRHRDPRGQPARRTS